jgi:hypothetical protein
LHQAGFQPLTLRVDTLISRSPRRRQYLLLRLLCARFGLQGAACSGHTQ